MITSRVTLPSPRFTNPLRLQPRLEHQHVPQVVGPVAPARLVLGATPGARAPRGSPPGRRSGQEVLGPARQRAAQPDAEGMPKPDLGRSNSARGTCRASTSRTRARGVIADVSRRAGGQRELDQRPGEQRDTRLEAHRHRGPVDLHQDVVGQVGGGVEAMSCRPRGRRGIGLSPPRGAWRSWLRDHGRGWCQWVTRCRMGRPRRRTGRRQLVHLRPTRRGRRRAGTSSRPGPRSTGTAQVSRPAPRRTGPGTRPNRPHVRGTARWRL